jgi:hypothetical protein
LSIGFKNQWRQRLRLLIHIAMKNLNIFYIL